MLIYNKYKNEYFVTQSNIGAVETNNVTHLKKYDKIPNAHKKLLKDMKKEEILITGDYSEANPNNVQGKKGSAYIVNINETGHKDKIDFQKIEKHYEKKITVYEVELPAEWASAIINDDLTGLQLYEGEYERYVERMVDLNNEIRNSSAEEWYVLEKDSETSELSEEDFKSGDKIQGHWDVDIEQEPSIKDGTITYRFVRVIDVLKPIYKEQTKKSKKSNQHKM